MSALRDLPEAPSQDECTVFIDVLIKSEILLSSLEPALTGGDDYELLVVVPRKRGGRLRGVQREARGVPLTRIGELTRDPEVVLVRGDRREPMPSGFSHF